MVLRVKIENFVVGFFSTLTLQTLLFCLQLTPFSNHTFFLRFLLTFTVLFLFFSQFLILILVLIFPSNVPHGGYVLILVLTVFRLLLGTLLHLPSYSFLNRSSHASTSLIFVHPILIHLPIFLLLTLCGPVISL